MLFLAFALGEQVWPGNWWPLLALAVISQLIGQGCTIYALGHLTPLVVGIALLIQPAVAALSGWIGFGETLSAIDIFGGMMVGAALVLIRLPNRAARPI